jgi:hypothetical protein
MFTVFLFQYKSAKFLANWLRIRMRYALRSLPAVCLPPRKKGRKETNTTLAPFAKNFADFAVRKK